MKNSLLLFGFIIILMSCTDKPKDIAPAKPKQFTQQDLLSCIRISDPKFSPDGKWVMYQQSTPNVMENSSNSDLFAVTISGTKRIQLTDSKKGDMGGVWSPKSDKIAYISMMSGSPQVYLKDFPDGKPRMLTNLENGALNLAFSPNGDMLSFTSEVKLDTLPSEKYPQLSKAKVKIYNKIPVRHWDEWEDENYQHVFVMDLKSGKVVDLMPGEKFDSPLKPFGGSEHIAWSPDSKEIIYTCKKVQDYAFSTNSDLFIYDFATGKTRNITEGMPGYDLTPKYSPDGKWIAFLSQERPGFESDIIRIMLYNRTHGQKIELTKNLDQWVEDYSWAPNSESIYFTATDSGTYQIFKAAIPDGQITKISNGKFNYTNGPDINPKGDKLVFCRQDMQNPPEVYSMDLNTEKISQLTFANKEFLAPFKKVDIKEKWITSTDGKQVHCWIIYPPDFDPSKKYPMLTFCQGGPQSMVSQVFHYRWNFYTMASHGYIVLAPNRRGLPGFGQAWNDAISLDWGGMAMQDILAATDAMMNEQYIDRDRIGAVGASAGGYAVFWLAGNHNNRFKAFVSHSGVFNLVSMYGSTEELFFTNWENGGPYWDAAHQSYYKIHSPHEYANNWNTPIMISTGGKDFRVPFTQSLEAFTVAQSKGIPSKLIYFPEQSHLILSLQEAVLWYNEYFEFLDTYLMKK